MQKPTKLEWKMLPSLKSVKGYGQHIWRDETSIIWF